MPKQPQNTGKKWASVQEKQLKKLVKGNTPTRLIAYKMKRSTASIYNHAAEMGLSLKPTNQSPYG